ncbi:MAG: hypothetical protein IK071_06360 [Lachnospiraceae bacterium]|nr:hypothetical protein [Lachnospiraceae bacterium]
MKKSKLGLGGTIVLLVLFAALVVGLYLMLTRDKDEGKLEADVDVSEYSTLKQRSLVTNYPQTAREVVKMYCRITKCLYNEDLTESQIEDLVDMLRMLYSEELLAENPREDMIGLVKGDIQSYKKFERTINSYSIDDSGDIVYVRTTKPAKASVNIYFTIKAGSAFERAYEEILLVEQAENVWKILGWRQSDDTSLKKDE